jgi:hypothetical protein
MTHNDNMTTDPFSQFSLRNLPHHAKWFVGIITALMLCVCIWAMWIFYERKGRVTAETVLPAYLHKADREEAVKLPPDVQKDVAEVQADSESVMAPEWDSNGAGKEKRIDSATLATIKIKAVNPDDDDWSDEKQFSHDLGLAHTHINGQTLLFFVIGFFYLFTSATPRNKKMLFIIFGISIFLHAVGLTGQHVNELFNDLLAVSGVAILVIMAYMAFRIFVDLGHAPVSEKAKE